MNAVILGRLTKDPENKGTAVQFSVAEDYFAKGGKQVSFWNCVAFGQTGERIAQHLKKGSSVLICGDARMESWESESGKRTACKVIVNSWQFAGGKAAAADDEEVF
jgi:single-strand DNA-binding protein